MDSHSTGFQAGQAKGQAQDSGIASKDQLHHCCTCIQGKNTEAQTEPKRGFVGYIVVYHIHQQRQKGMLDQLQLLQQPLPLK